MDTKIFAEQIELKPVKALKIEESYHSLLIITNMGKCHTHGIYQVTCKSLMRVFIKEHYCNFTEGKITKEQVKTFQVQRQFISPEVSQYGVIKGRISHKE